jgi:hypothetical protein
MSIFLNVLDERTYQRPSAPEFSGWSLKALRCNDINALELHARQRYCIARGMALKLLDYLDQNYTLCDSSSNSRQSIASIAAQWLGIQGLVVCKYTDLALLRGEVDTGDQRISTIEAQVRDSLAFSSRPLLASRFSAMETVKEMPGAASSLQWLDKELENHLLKRKVHGVGEADEFGKLVYFFDVAR